MPTSASSGIHLDVGHIGLTTEDHLPDLPLPADQPRPDPRQLFFGIAATDPAHTRPLDLEIGSGKGTFLVQQAPLEPDTLFLGVEYAKAFWRHAADRVRRHDLPNVRLLHADAVSLVTHYLPDRCVRQAHIYFPDPWPKARHHKRRSVREDVLRELHRILQDPPEASGMRNQESGPNESTGPPSHFALQTSNLAPCVRIATDHADYFAWMEEHAAKVDDIFERLPYEPPASAGEGEWVGTNFERKYKNEGRQFNGMILRKR